MEPLLRVKEVAQALALSPSEVYDMIARGYLPAVRMGRSVRVSAETLLRWLDGKTVGDALLSAETANASADSTDSGGEPTTTDCPATIIIPSYNHFSDCTQPLLRRLLLQFPNMPNGDPEVLVVDDGSTDGTQHFSDYFGTGRFLHKSHGGFAAACNYGATQARGQTLIFLNNDCLPEDGWLAPLLAAVKNRGGIAGPRIVDPGAPGGHLSGGYATASAGLAQAADGTWSNMNFLLDSQPYEVRAVTGACLAVDRATFLRLGGFDESFGEAGGCEDVDLCLRAGILGLPITVVPESVVAHREGTTRFAPELLSGTRQQIAQAQARLIERWGVGTAQPAQPAAVVSARTTEITAAINGPREATQGGSIGIVNGALIEYLPGHSVAIASRSGADVLISHYWSGPDSAWEVPAPDAPPWVIICPWEQGAPPSAWQKAWVHPSFRRLITPSEHSRQLFLAHTPLLPEQVTVIPNGFDSRVFRPDGPVWASEGDRFRVLYVGGFIGRKGIDILLRAWAIAFTADEPVRLILKRQGAKTFYRHGPDLSQVIASLANVTVIDEDALPAEDMASLYRACNVTCQPYRAESFCLPVLESLASGTPVVTSKSGPAAEYVSEEYATLLPSEGYEGPAAQDVARALRWWYMRRHLPPEREAVSASVSLYDWHIVAGEYGRVLREVVRDA